MVNSDDRFDYDKVVNQLDQLVQELQDQIIFLVEEARAMRDLADAATKERDEFVQLAQTYEEEKSCLQQELTKAQQDLKDTRTARDGLRVDVTNQKSEIKLLNELVSNYESGLITTTKKMTDLVEIARIDEESIAPAQEDVEVVASGIFVCRAGDQYDSFCSGVFDRLKQNMRQIDFGEEPMFVRSDMGHNRPVSLAHKKMDVVVILAAGFSHSDVTAIRKCVPDGVHIVTSANHLIQIIQNLNIWLDSRQSLVH